LEGKRTPNVWEREAATKGRKLYEWSETYISFCIVVFACMRVVVGNIS
jgi:hypothetical protein